MRSVRGERPVRRVKINEEAFARYVSEREMTPNTAAVFKAMIYLADPDTGIYAEGNIEWLAAELKPDIPTWNYHYKLMTLRAHGAIGKLKNGGDAQVVDFTDLAVVSPRQVESIRAAHAEYATHPQYEPPKAVLAGTTLYRIYDAADTLLYAGIAVDPGRRLHAHEQQKRWWGQVATITTQHFRTRAEAEAAEREAIRVDRPLYNVAWAVAEQEAS